MFLDDELLEICKNWDCSTPEQIQALNDKICKTCEAYYKSKLTATTLDKQLKIVLDRTFNLFDSFVRQAEKSEDAKIIRLSDMFKEYTFKRQFLSNKKMNEIYNKLLKIAKQ